jgi:hypothetical protein
VKLCGGNRGNSSGLAVRWSTEEIYKSILELI